MHTSASIAPDPACQSAAARSHAPERTPAGRVTALDGLRGLMMLFVLFSHYCSELPHGLHSLSLGWVGVIVFFVLSGFLVGRLIIEKQDAGNFLVVFYLRRLCRTVPTYVLTVGFALLLSVWLADRPWVNGDDPLPGWSYLVFMQNLFFVTRESYGLHWLSPTWTLALEEQFYLVAPILFLAVPRRHWIGVLLAVCAGGLALRAVGILTGTLGFAPLALMPASMDVLSAGLLLAVLVKRGAIDWARWSLPLRVAPILVLFTIAIVQRLDGGEVGPRFQILGPGLMALVAALLILMLVQDAPEAARFRSPILVFFGRISYSVYLTHLLVLGLMHGLLLGTEPDVATPAQMAVTALSAAITIGLSSMLTRLIEEPVTAWARGLRWSAPARSRLVVHV